jgi:hypothetical protein
LAFKLCPVKIVALDRGPHLQRPQAYDLIFCVRSLPSIPTTASVLAHPRRPRPWLRMVRRRRAGDSSPPSSVASNVEGSHGTPAEIPPSSPCSPANPRAVNGSVKDGAAASERGLHSPPLLHPRPRIFFSARGRASSSPLVAVPLLLRRH